MNVSGLGHVNHKFLGYSQQKTLINNGSVFVSLSDIMFFYYVYNIQSALKTKQILFSFPL